MEWQDILGGHMLCGFDRFTDQRPAYDDADYNEDCEVCRIDLDGDVIEVTENPSDGYRSHHEGPTKCRAKIKNAFTPVHVVAVHKRDGDYGNDDDLLVLYVVETGEEVLRVGTRNADDYYPSWVCNYTPEAIPTPPEEQP